MCDTSRAARESALRRPRWGALYATVLPQVAALGAVEASQSPAALRVALRCLLALGLFATMAVWERANRPALDLQHWCDCAGQRTAIRVIPSRRARDPALMQEEYEVARR